jgi:hypothetical protein
MREPSITSDYASHPHRKGEKIHTWLNHPTHMFSSFFTPDTICRGEEMGGVSEDGGCDLLVSVGLECDGREGRVVRRGGGVL